MSGRRFSQSVLVPVFRGGSAQISNWKRLRGDGTQW